KKMSKSLGNSIDPLEIIDKYGCDALRFSLITIAASGSDIYLSSERFEQGRNFANKIWNASRFIMMNIKDGVTGDNIDVKNLKIQDQWILNSLLETERSVAKCIDSFRFNEALNTVYEFFWHKFCDWYVELSKQTIAENNTQEVLLRVLKESLLMLSPFMPFITDEIFSKLPGERYETIAVAKWPVPKKEFENKHSANAMELLFGCVFSLRNRRAELNLSSSIPLRVRVLTSAKKESDLKVLSGLIKNLSNVSEFEVSVSNEPVPDSLGSMIDKDTNLYLLLEGLVDPEKEKQRIDKEITEFSKQVLGKEKMLSNKDFVKKAPEAVIEKERKKLADLKETIIRLKEVRNAFK
ncbi:MAG TPA: class I tRNA ligase family protein, partial [Candidatus Omnitrophota bacterium]|nr:class I tRNA ligase family protein [Candidatus Omnitrophota bacterium]